MKPTVRDLNLLEIYDLLERMTAALEASTAKLSELQNLEGEKMIDEMAARFYLGSVAVAGREAQPLSEKTMWSYRNQGLVYYMRGKKIWYKLKDLDNWRNAGRSQRPTDRLRA